MQSIFLASDNFFAKQESRQLRRLIAIPIDRAVSRRSSIVIVAEAQGFARSEALTLARDRLSEHSCERARCFAYARARRMDERGPRNVGECVMRRSERFSAGKRTGSPAGAKIGPQVAAREALFVICLRLRAGPEAAGRIPACAQTLRIDSRWLR